MSIGVATHTVDTRRPRRRRRVPWTGPTTPDRLRRVGVVLAVGAVVTAAVSVLSGLSRTAAVSDTGSRIASLTSDAATLYQSLADADAMATSGYVSGGREPASLRARYDDDVARAAERLVHAAGQLPDGDPAAAPVATITAHLPVYTGLIETARTYNRQGLPLGQSYLDSGSRLMRVTILPAAAEMRTLQTTALATAYRQGGAIPFAVLLLGVALLAALVDLALRERARTQRVFSPGLVAAGALILAAVAWWAGVTAVAGGALDGARRHSDAATALDDARAAVLQARSNESLVLVARSGGSADQTFAAELERVAGVDGTGGLLADAAAQDVDVTGVRAATRAWQDAHRALRELDDAGRYREAVTAAVGTDPDGSGAVFDRLDAALADVVAAERAAFVEDVGRAESAQTLLAAGPAVLVLLAGVAVVLGIGRRVGEYR